METILKRFLVLIVAMLALTSVFAQEVDEATAQQRALNFLQKSSSKSKAKNGKTPAMNVTLAHTSKGDLGNNYYAYNIGVNDGFVLVSADEKAEEILGYADKGLFDYATMPANVKWWLSQYDSQIASLRKTTVSVKSNTAANTGGERTDIAPMIKTKWNQGYPYNCTIPTLGAEYTGDNGLATGCVATAMAQIMNYYEYPTVGKGSHSYTKTFPEVDNMTLTFEADFANTTYDWGNMLNTYDGSESQASRDAVGQLMYHCGVAVDMDYGLINASGSGAANISIPGALINHFGYDKSMTMEDRAFYSTSKWEDMVYDELSANRPVLYLAHIAAGLVPKC